MRPLPRFLPVLTVLGVLVTASVTLVGSGNIGAVGPKWSVTQQCTPVAPGDTSGGVGSASLDAFKRSTSVFAIDNDFTLTDPTAGSFRGNVVASPVVGRKVHLDVAGKLNFLVADRTVDPVWYDAADPLIFGAMGSGTGQFTQPYSIAVDPFDDSIFVMTAGTGGVGRYTVVKFNSAGVYVTEFGSYGSGDGQFGGFSGLAVSPIDGTVAVGDGSNYRVQLFTPDGPRTTYTFLQKVGTNGTGNSQFGSTQPIPVVFNSLGALYAADRGNARIQRFTISGSVITYSAQVSVVGYHATTPIYALTAPATGGTIEASLVTSLDPGAPGEIRFFAANLLSQGGTGPITAPPGTSGGIFNIAFDPNGGRWVNWGGSNYLSHITIPLGPSSVEDNRWYSGYPSAPDLNTNYGIAVKTTGEVVVLFKSTTFQTQPGLYGDNRVTSFDWTPVPLSDAIENYMLECDSTLGGMTYSYDASTDPDVIFPAWSGDVWAHLKEICTAFQVDIIPDGNTIRITDIGDREIVLRNHSPLKVTPSNLFGGQQIIVVAQNPTAGGGTVYDASTQNTRFQIDVGQTQTVTVNTLNYPAQVDGLVATDSLPVLPGQYYVLDSTGTHVPAATWVAAGGSVTASLGDIPGQVKFTLKLQSGMAGYSGPFTFADSITSTGRAALILTGSGVFTSPVSYTFETGANPTKTTQLIARTINSFAIADMEQVARVTPAAIDDVSGYNVEMSFEIFTSDLLGFGLTQGAMFTAEDSRWRVTNIQWGAVKSGITATRHVTLDDLDTITAGLTVDQRDAIWTGYSTDDRGIKPLALAL